MTRRYIVLCVALGVLPYAQTSSLAREAPRDNPSSQQAEVRLCDTCKSYSVEVSPRTDKRLATLLVSDDIPLEFSSLRLNFKNGGFQDGSFVLENSSMAGLVTLVISWSFQGDGPGPLEAQATTEIDSWATDKAFLLPGTKEREELTFQIFGRPGEALRRATGTVLYAEFDDGTHVGAGVNTVGSRLRLQRTQVLAECKKLLAQIQTGGDPEAISAYLQAAPDLRWLREVYAREGLEGLLEQVAKPRYLAP